MNRKYLKISLFLVFSLVSVGVFGVNVIAKNNPSQTVRPLEDEDVLLDLTHENFIEREKKAIEMGPIANEEELSVEPVEIGEEFTITVSDNGLGIDYDETFVVLMEGTHGIILITKDANESFDGYYHFANPIGDDSEPWLRTEDLLTNEQLEYMLDEFDNNIYPTNTKIFGEPLPRGDEGQKVWILIFNIRDEAYYYPEAESYIAGYFSASESTENKKNIMHIDTYDWINRIGPDVNRPYLYEGVFAHEFQHLIHFDQDPDEPSWVDEACAELAMYMCGYGHPSGHLMYYMYYHPMTSLTFWGNALEDYGIVYLWSLYMYEHYGGADFISALVQEQANGIIGVENTLKSFGYTESFEEIYDALTIAIYIDDVRKNDGKFGFYNLDVGSDDTWGWSIEYVLSYGWWGLPSEAPFLVPSNWFLDIEPQPYTAHYFRFTNKKAADVFIDGDDYSGNPAYSGIYEWYSDASAWAWQSFYQSFYIPPSGATLNFYTFYEIEEDWDYGYVEVYDTVTEEWSTLNAAATVDTLDHPQDNPNTPDDREPSAYVDAGLWHAFTGNSGGWIPVSMDLSPFAGHTIEIYFTLWQDGAFTLQNMYIDDISIPEKGFFDDVEYGEDGWESTGWYISNGLFDNGWSTTIIDTKGVPTEIYPEPPDNNRMTLHSIYNVPIDFGTQSGSMRISATTGKSGRIKVAIVSNRAYHILTSGYILAVI